jgi:hypothetical protein
MKRVLLFCVFFSSLQASSQTQYTFGHVIIGKRLAIPGNMICHSYDQLFFRSLESCEDYNFSIGFAAGLEPIECVSEPLGDIRQMERIRHRGGDILRFFIVDLQYEELIETNYANPEGQTIKNTVIRNKFIPRCGSDALVPERYSVHDPFEVDERDSTPDEQDFLDILTENNVRVVNQPAGPLTDFNMIDPDLSREASIVLDQMNLRTPYCQNGSHSRPSLMSGELTGSGIVFKASGELTGSGWRVANLSELQANSRAFGIQLGSEDNNSTATPALQCLD